MQKNANSLLVYITVPDRALARELAFELVKNNLAAGVNISDEILSVYRWQGEIVENNEFQMLIQTSARNFSNLEQFVRKRHPYLVPCVIGMNIAQGSRPFLEWVESGGN